MRQLFLLTILASVCFSYQISAQHFHGQPTSEPVNYDSLFAAATPLSESSDGQKLLQVCLDSYGGKDALAQIESMSQTWTMVSRNGQDSMDVVKTISADRRYKIERYQIDFTERRMIDGDLGWIQHKDTSIEINSGRYKAELFSNLILRMPAAIENERFDDLRFGRRTDDPLSYIYMKKNDTLIVTVGIDPEDGLIKAAEGIVFQEGQRFIFVNHFSDHRKAGETVVPYKMTNISMGLTVGNSVLQSVEFNKKYSEKDFRPITERDRSY